jgi:hypothetical protein
MSNPTLSKELLLESPNGNVMAYLSIIEMKPVDWEVSDERASGKWFTIDTTPLRVLAGKLKT